MKRIFLFHIIVSLLLCSNVWAITRTAGNASEFEDAWINAQDGDVIKLTDAIALTKTMWLGTTNMDDASRKIEIDLNGYNLLSSAQYAFLLTHGTLKISNSRPASGQMQGTYKKMDSSGNYSGSANLFYITGSTNKDVDPSVDEVNYFSHLEIDEGVIVTQEHYDALVTVMELNKNSVGQKAYTADQCVPAKPALTYITNVYASSETTAGKSVAHGVRVDLKGTINGTKYGIKSNGNLESPFASVDAGTTSVPFAPSTDFTNVNSYTIANSDVNYSPFIYIHPTARITVLNAAPAGIDKNPVSVYASGYARWKVEGYVEGCSGAVIKSGQVDFTDATVIGTGPVYEEATASNSGTTSSGSGIVVASTDAYAGNIEVSIGGDSEISSQNGYAIEEVITSSDNKTDVETVSISGGSFEGSSDQGTIKIIKTTTTNETTVIEVTGGQIVGADPDDDEAVNIGGLSLTEFLTTAEEEGTQGKTHVTVTTDENGDKVMVIVSGEIPTGSEEIATHNEEDAVNWKHSSSLDKTPMAENITANLKLDQLQINQDYSQIVTIKDGVTLEVGSVVLGENAQIIVEPGATFKVTKKDGVYSPKSSNLILQTKTEKPSIFLANPTVTTNAHPKATVQMYSDAYKIAEGQYQWQRFGSPSYLEDIHLSDVLYDAALYPTAVYRLNTTDPLRYNKWEKMSDNDVFVPFGQYNLTTSNSNPGAIYTFQCSLVGNTDATLNLYARYNFLTNSYTAPISISNLIDDLVSQYPHLSGTLYIPEYTGAGKYTWQEINEAWATDTNIDPLKPFVLVRRTTGDNPIVDYNHVIWEPMTNSSPAPARESSPFSTARIQITADDGTTDGVYLVEGNRFSPKFDNSYDAEKLTIEDQPYLYASGCEGKMGILATDNIEGTTLSIQSTDQTSFTMHFSHVNGLGYAIRDELTGTETAIAEGAIYMFSVPANITVTDRFKIVAAKKVPTSIDTIEANNATKGIYTIHGQYAGTDFHSLPAGIYIVDGKKIVK